MKFINQLFFWALLAVCGAAQADTNYVPMDPGAPGLFTNTWTYNSVPGAHGVFDEVFSFNVPDTENISIAAIANSAGVSFIGGGLALFEFGSGNLLAVQLASAAGAVYGGSWTLSSGTYAFEFIGTYLVDNASYTATVTGMPAAVPEPSSVLLLLAGLAMLAAIARVRSSKN